MPFRVAAFYRFTPIHQPVALRQELLQAGLAAGLRGTVLVADEGVNGTICGSAAGVEGLLELLRRQSGLADLEARTSWSGDQAFHRLKVRLKREIVTMGCASVQLTPPPAAEPASRPGTPVPPQAWQELIADPTTLVIDTRNSYEVALGSFAGAIDPGLESFREFPQWVDQELAPLVAARRPERLALFCTGGIRCEKATAYLRQQGFEGVHHLQGGILRYLEEVPPEQSHWQGECYVFDQRVALNHRLEPGGFSLCHACGLPLSPADRQLDSYLQGVSCRHCRNRFSDADRARFAERQRQSVLAASRGGRHIGAGAGAADAEPAGLGGRAGGSPCP
ncbi:rhodanese-related sulfurtransferase [Synechococcus sp. ATX 2A4]|nr:rhodanese-related sulfurtransferase [Synechococcus sp. ATX 2A4]